MTPRFTVARTLAAVALMVFAVSACSPSTLLTLRVEATQFLDVADTSQEIPVPTPPTSVTLPAPIDRYFPDQSGFVLADLGLSSDVASALEGLSFDLVLDVTSALASADPDATGALDLTVTLFIAEAGSNVDTGIEVATDTVSLAAGEGGTITLSVDMASDENAAAYATVQSGNAALGVQLTLDSTLVTPGGPNELNVTATIETLNLGITSGLNALLNF